MDGARTHSDPEPAPNPTKTRQRYDDSALRGVAANVKLLLKLIQDHKGACEKESNDKQRMLRVATMITIIDNVRVRIQKCQSFGNKRSAELRRCNTNVGTSDGSTRIMAMETMADDKDKVKREMNASLAARKSLEIICSSLGREKEIMALELSRKEQELGGMEEEINDLKEQNKTLIEKLGSYKKSSFKSELESESIKALKEQNEALREQLLRSLRGYKLMRRKLKEVEQENMMIRGTLGAKVEKGLGRVQSFKDNLSLPKGSISKVDDVQEDMAALENMLKRM